jgi:hypothetical protein
VKLQQLRRARRGPLHDPYPWMAARLAQPAPPRALPGERGPQGILRPSMN